MNASTMISAIRNSTHLGVRIRAVAPATPVANPINVALLVDTSGSMEGDRIAAVKRTLHAARALFLPVDTMTMVVFSDGARVVADHLALDAAGLEEFYTAVDAIHADGGTNLSEGIEKLIILRRDKPYDAVLLLTDGMINRGIVTNSGLQSMIRSLGSVAITALGYGADHNRILLRDLAVQSHGSYVYVDDESVLPLTMGDLIGGLRAEVLKDAIVSVPSGWECCELGGGRDASYKVGNIVPDRDYWVVFKKRFVAADVEAAPIALSGCAGELTRVPFSDCLELQEQVLRCAVAEAVVAASDKMERGQPIGPEVAALNAEFDVLSEAMLARPLVVRMRAQLAEILAVRADMPPLPSCLARMSSGGAVLSTQRGRTGPSDPTAFTSPCQRIASQQVAEAYSTAI